MFLRASATGWRRVWEHYVSACQCDRVEEGLRTLCFCVPVRPGGVFENIMFLRASPTEWRHENIISNNTHLLQRRWQTWSRNVRRARDDRRWDASSVTQRRRCTPPRSGSESWHCRGSALRSPWTCRAEWDPWRSSRRDVVRAALPRHSPHHSDTPPTPQSSLYWPVPETSNSLTMVMTTLYPKNAPRTFLKKLK